MNESLRIKNCPYGNEELLRSRLTCPQLWDDLEQTDTERVRFCSACKRNVHHVITDEEIGRAIREDQCIAWEVPDDIREKYAVPPFLLGSPNASVGPMSRKLLID